MNENHFDRFAQYLQRQWQADEGMRYLINDLDGSLEGFPESAPQLTNATDFPITGTGFSVLTLFTLRFLYRWATDYLTHRRSLQDIEVAKQQIQLIDELVDEGWDKKTATHLVISQLSIIAKRTDGDPAIKQILAFFEKSKEG